MLLTIFSITLSGDVIVDHEVVILPFTINFIANVAIRASNQERKQNKLH